MITVEGRVHIKRYLARMVPAIARSIAFGIGNNGETVNDTKLQFEAGRSDVALTSYNFVNDRLTFKALVDESFGGVINEVALYSAASDDVAGEYGSRIITTFDSDLEEWVDATSGVAGTYTTIGTRLGADSLLHAPTASGTKTDTMTNLFLDLSGYSAADKFVFAFGVNNAFVSSIKFRFMTDTANYYEFTLGAQTIGYKITELAKSAAVATGSPDWGNITEVRVTTNATAGGTANIQYEGIRIDDADTFNQDYVLVAREVLSTPYVKKAGMVQEVEFNLDVIIT